MVKCSAEKKPDLAPPAYEPLPMPPLLLGVARPGRANARKSAG
jgi:hypothetical protein